ncbi:MAG: hypothetical protein DI617_09325, partial [Streptococcus pyogenes]
MANGGSSAEVKGFSSYDQFLYERYVLQPFSIYRVRAGTQYVLVTSQKTLFRVDVVPEELADDLEERGLYRYASPTADRVLRPSASVGYVDRPPATPIWSPPADVPQQQQHQHRSLEKRPRGRPRLSQQHRDEAKEQPRQPADREVPTGLERDLIEELFKELEPTVSPLPPDPPQQQQQQPSSQLMIVPETTRAQELVTWIVQQQPPPPPQQQERREVATITDPDEDSCKCCLKPRTGLGIAKKRIQLTSPAPAERPRKIPRPLDLSCDT